MCEHTESCRQNVNETCGYVANRGKDFCLKRMDASTRDHACMRKIFDCSVQIMLMTVKMFNYS
jgi:hypothetical protein